MDVVQCTAMPSQYTSAFYAPNYAFWPITCLSVVADTAVLWLISASPQSVPTMPSCEMGSTHSGVVTHSEEGLVKCFSHKEIMTLVHYLAQAICNCYLCFQLCKCIHRIPARRSSSAVCVVCGTSRIRSEGCNNIQSPA